MAKQLFSEVNITNNVVYLGDPKRDNRTVVPLSTVENDVAVMKACKMERTGRFSLKPSLFTNMSTNNAPGKVLFFARDQTLMYFNTTVLSDVNCPTDKNATGSTFAYIPERHVCTETDKTASCSVNQFYISVEI
jgi:hypothetical protein